MAKKSTPYKPTKEQVLTNTISRAVAEQSTISRPMVPQAMPAQETAPASTPDRIPEKSNTGEATVLWFHPEDKQRIRELVAYLASQGVPRLNNSLVIKTALRAVQMNEDLLAAYHQAAQSDRRLKKYKAQ